MILPKVHHHLVELPFTHDRPGQLRRLDVTNNSLRSASEVPQLWIVRQRLATRVTLAGRRVAFGAQLHLLATTRLLNLSKGLDEIRGLRVERLVMRNEVVRH